MPKRQSIEIWVAINEDGEYSLGCDSNEALEKYREDYEGGLLGLICIVADVPLPEPLRGKVTVVAHAEEITAKGAVQ